MNFIEEILLNTGCSWQAAMLLPFLIISLLGMFIGFLIFKVLHSKFLRLSLAIFIGFLLTGVYFAFYPIYISDLNNEFRIENYVSDNQQNQTFLEVLVLPDCPYCIYSTELVKKLAIRNANAEIIYRIISEDTYGGGIEEKLKMEGLKYNHAQYNDKIKALAKGSFPSFVFHVKGAKEVQVWNNNTFGSKALDYIEGKL
tara:strand:- start:2805 stop:3401 length:597 start_codon:yes stop_codon:yes gene_type:complete